MRDTGDTPDNVTKLAIAGLKDDVTKNLKMRVELSVGMKAMVVLNIATDADIVIRVWNMRDSRRLRFGSEREEHDSG